MPARVERPAVDRARFDPPAVDHPGTAAPDVGAHERSKMTFVKEHRRAAGLLASCAALIVMAAFLATAAVSESTAGGTLRMSSTPDITLDPPNAPGETDILVLHNVYQTLVGYSFAK